VCRWLAVLVVYRANARISAAPMPSVWGRPPVAKSSV
jgi:hypothetical protein